MTGLLAMTDLDDERRAACCSTTNVVFHAHSGLAAYDRARFHGGPPIHGAPIQSRLGYSAMFQDRQRRVTEVVADGSNSLILFMIISREHAMDVWMDGRHQGCVRFHRGDLIVVPPGMSSRWCAREGQASVMHLHISGERLAETLADEPERAALDIAPRLAFRDPALEQILTKITRLDEADPLSHLQVAALGASALLRVLRHPPMHR